MVVIRRNNHETQESLIRRFTQAVREDGVIDLFKSRQCYVKDSEKRKLEHKAKLALIKKFKRLNF